MLARRAALEGAWDNDSDRRHSQDRPSALFPRLPYVSNQNGYPPGMTPGSIGVISGPLTRFPDFSISLMRLRKPEGSKLAWVVGANIADNCNRLVRELHGDWLWVMGDDHVFAPDILMRLLQHNVDVVVPLCLQKSPPFLPVVFSEEDEDGRHRYADLPEHGLAEIHAAGSAGILIRKHVLDVLPRPVFGTERGQQNEDLLLCRKIREAGFQIYCDVDTHLGHMGTMCVWPQFQEAGWAPKLDVGDEHFVSLPPLPVEMPTK